MGRITQSIYTEDLNAVLKITKDKKMSVNQFSLSHKEFCKATGLNRQQAYFARYGQHFKTNGSKYEYPPKLVKEVDWTYNERGRPVFAQSAVEKIKK